MALTSLFQVGHYKETEGYLSWLNEIILKSKHKNLQVMYRLDGSEEMKEENLPHLEGFRGSRPVRIGNDASGQKQFSIYGHVLIAAHLLALRSRTIEPELWQGLCLMCDFVINHWREPDWSIWEMRTAPQHFVHSKVMCWVTLEKCIRIAGLTGSAGNIEQWKKVRDEICFDVMSRGWNPKRQSFVLHYDTDALDGSTLLMSMNDFIPFDDPRMLATVEALRTDLSQEGFIYRYLADDGLPGREGTFLACTLWLITNLARQGELEDAELLLNKVDQVAGPLHLLAEEYDPEWQEQLGNFPQAFSHEAYITAAMAIVEAKSEQRHKQPIQNNFILPVESKEWTGAPSSITELSDILAGIVVSCGRQPDYASLAASSQAEKLGKVLRNLQSFELDKLETREEQTSFWCNLYNALVLSETLEMRVALPRPRSLARN
jgi:GH15 family glucan-1,4-alpha-glucosidase